MPHQSSVALRVPHEASQPVGFVTRPHEASQPVGFVTRPHEASQPGSPQAASGEAAVNAAMIKLEARTKSRAAGGRCLGGEHAPAAACRRRGRDLAAAAAEYPCGCGSSSTSAALAAISHCAGRCNAGSAAFEAERGAAYVNEREENAIPEQSVYHSHVDVLCGREL